MNTNIPNYEVLSLRGSGAFGYVIEAYDHDKDIRVAIKRSHKAGFKISREYEVLTKLNDCDYIIKLLKIFYTVNDEGKVFQNLVFEYANNSLESFIDEFRRNKKYIPLEKIKQISKQILQGIDYIHKKNVIHRDLKPENILFFQDENVKICDFGSSKFIKDKKASTPYIVSRYYRAPELILGKTDYDEKIDIFAAGCIIAELFTLIPLFPGKAEGLQILEHISVLGNPGKDYFSNFNLPKDFIDYFAGIEIEGITKFEKLINANKFYPYKEVKNAVDLILNMIKWNSEDRFSAEQCLNQPFFKGKENTCQ